APAGGPPAILCTLHAPHSRPAEAYRGLRTALLVAARDQHSAIQITAPETGEGTSVLAANLAISLTQAGKRILLIDANLRRPMIHTLFQLQAPVGLSTL